MSNPAADFAATRFELSTDAAGLWDRMADLTTLLSYVPGVGAVTSEGSIVSARMRLKLSAVPAVYRILADWESRDDASRTAVLNVLATDRRTSRVRHLRLRTTVADGAGGGCELRVVLEPGRTSPRRASMRLPQARFWTGWCLSSPDGSWTHRCPLRPSPPRRRWPWDRWWPVEAMSRTRSRSPMSLRVGCATRGSPWPPSRALSWPVPSPYLRFSASAAGSTTPTRNSRSRMRVLARGSGDERPVAPLSCDAAGLIGRAGPSVEHHAAVDDQHLAGDERARRRRRTPPPWRRRSARPPA